MGLRDDDCGNYDTNIDFISACYMIPPDGTFYVYTLASCEPSCSYTQNCVYQFLISVDQSIGPYECYNLLGMQ